uniref:Carbonic anhydrase 6 n=1 Tax=Magallana gigas TaxID=29159 RepID=K1S2Z6_MAGGI
MAALYWLAFLGSLCIGTVEGAGYLGRMPHHGGSCYYEDIKNAHFSYDEETCRRPDKWCCLHKCWATCGSTRRQSPINLDTSEARRTNANLKLYNIDKRAHMVFYNSKYEDISEAKPKDDGLAVIGVMIQAKSCCRSNYWNYEYREHDEESFSKKCYEGAGNHSNTVIECGITPADVLPYDQRFYTYPGSLTTPPCYESVQWIVYKCPIKVSRKAFKALQRVEDTDNNPLKEHGVRRPLQTGTYIGTVSIAYGKAIVWGAVIPACIGGGCGGALMRVKKT